MRTACCVPGGRVFLQTAPVLSPSGSHLPRLKMKVPLYLLVGRRAAYAAYRWIAANRPHWIDTPPEASSFLTAARDGRLKVDDVTYRVTVRSLRRAIRGAGFHIMREDLHVSGLARRYLPERVAALLPAVPFARDVLITNMEVPARSLTCPPPFPPKRNACGDGVVSCPACGSPSSPRCRPSAPGIAHYAAELLPSLARRHAIDVYPNDRRAPDTRLNGISAFSAHDFVWKQARTPYDLVVYQLGNNTCHDYMWAYMTRYPGLVVLHDGQLHQSRARALIAGRRERRRYRAELAFDHPDAPPGIADSRRGGHPRRQPGVPLAHAAAARGVRAAGRRTQRVVRGSDSPEPPGRRGSSASGWASASRRPPRAGPNRPGPGAGSGSASRATGSYSRPSAA